MFLIYSECYHCPVIHPNLANTITLFVPIGSSAYFPIM
ncbi:hypothetical protein [Floridanema evergladense]|uniref:Uncharacterized protein n=1 Tax=Floridaenema evergladense BLCC-F167 TaxID=3153639 RepID=A0ABV4WI33_9CYAN